MIATSVVLPAVTLQYTDTPIDPTYQIKDFGKYAKEVVRFKLTFCVSQCRYKD